MGECERRRYECLCVCMNKRKEKRIEREGSDCVAGQERGREIFVIVSWGSCGSENLRVCLVTYFRQKSKTIFNFHFVKETENWS